MEEEEEEEAPEKCSIQEKVSRETKSKSVPLNEPRHELEEFLRNQALHNKPESNKEDEVLKIVENKNKRESFQLPEKTIQIGRKHVKKNRKEARQRHKLSLRKVLNITHFILLPDDAVRAGWTAYLLLLLAYVTTITPFRTAFHDYDTLPWILVDSFVDLCFLVDMIQNFFYAYYDSDGNIVVDRKKIASKYLRTWFALDLIAIVPFNLMFNREAGSVSSVSRIPRVYRLLKMTKIVRTLRLCRERSNWMGKLERFIPELSPGAERLLAFALSFTILCHVTACCWYLTAKVEGIFPDSWVARYGFQDETIYEKYIAAFYFTVTTITTVGYGDISPGTHQERWFGVILMLIGVMAYTFAISSLSSIITTNDIRETRKNEALDLLHRIDMKYQLTTNDYLTINQHIIKKFKEVESFQSEEALLNILGREDRLILKRILYQQVVKEMTCFKNSVDFESPEFIDFSEDISTMFKHRKYQENKIIYREKEKVSNIYFIVKGSINYVLTKFDDDPYDELREKGQIFGELEIFNGILEGSGIWGKHIFTTKTKEESEFLVISKTDLMRLYKSHNKLVQLIFKESYQKLLELSERKDEKINDLKEQLKYSEKQMFKQKKKSLKSLPSGLTPSSSSHRVQQLRAGETIQSKSDTETESSFGSTEIKYKPKKKKMKSKKHIHDFLKNINLQISDYMTKELSRIGTEEKGEGGEQKKGRKVEIEEIKLDLGENNADIYEHENLGEEEINLEKPPFYEGGISNRISQESNWNNITPNPKN